jgi:hypothetical protein
VVSANITEVMLAVVVTLIVSVCFQYVLTLAETALFDGTLPPLWKINWTEGGPLPWLMTGALLCLAVDVLLNLGGVGFAMGKLHEADIGQATFNFSDALVLTIEKAGTLLFAMLCAVGPELLKAYAVYIETGSMPVKRPQQEHQQPKRNPDVEANHAAIQARAMIKREMEANGRQTRRVSPDDIRID